MPEFKPFPKIPRWLKPIVVTEKIDGTNASIHLTPYVDKAAYLIEALGVFDGLVLRAGSRNRWITPGNDNFGFAGWALKHAEELAQLGEGSHYGEWWGAGIQRRYGLDHKRFSLFNVDRWNDANTPDCCHVVPALGTFDSPFDIDRETGLTAAGACLIDLLNNGSRAAPGFMDPEGVMIYHTAANQYFKLPFDPAPKAA